MRVLIDTSFAARGPSGTAVYIEHLVAALRARGNLEVVETRRRRRPAPGRSRARHRVLWSGVNAVLDVMWLQVGLRARARRARADVIHHPLPAWMWRAPCAQVITVHDLAFEHLPEGFGRVWRLLARRRHRAAARRAGAVICVSRAAGADAVGILGADPEKVVVAPHGPGQALPGDAASGGEPAHFLYVGDDEPRKRVPALLEAHRRYAAGRADALPLVLAGSAAGRANGEPRIVGEPRPDAKRLRELLSGAAALVHSSADEGFGLTLAEAMAAGVAVLAVRNPGTHELCGPAALLVAPDELAAGMARLHDERELRAELARRGRERARRFSWDESARLHEEAYTLAAMQGRTR
ncbi:MAG TPA: glycosyltransferase family 1 protein [Thermoleophilaceae bacterium]|nr:glycosyltransferase family 1 protein [Thermoleophilaceae bacterium]